MWDCAAVVTGAASGLGAETARYLAEAGAKVTLIDIDQDGVETLAGEIGAMAIPCDVAGNPRLYRPAHPRQPRRLVDHRHGVRFPLGD